MNGHDWRPADVPKGTVLVDGWKCAHCGWRLEKPHRFAFKPGDHPWKPGPDDLIYPDHMFVKAPGDALTCEEYVASQVMES